MPDRLSEYNQRLATLTSVKQNLQKKQNPLPVFRLAIFIGIVLLSYYFLTSQSFWSGLTAALTLFLFVGMSIYDNKLKNQIIRVEILEEINTNELSALSGDYSLFNAGNEFVNGSHDYTHDLDIFGEGSVFQYMNRTATIFGKLRLADYLSNAFQYCSQVIKRQDAVKELSGMVEERQELQLMFHNEKISESDKAEMTQWLQSESPVKNLKLLQILSNGLPAITLVCIMLSIAGIIAFPGLLIVLQWIIVLLYARQTLKVQTIITSKSKILNKYAQSLNLIEKTDFRSEYFATLRKRLAVTESQGPSKTIHQLSVILNYMDQNLNILVSVILNGLFMFNLHLLLRAEKWKNDNKMKAADWFDAIADFDALSSLANFAYNHPDFTFPQMLETEFQFRASELGHPLIASDERVINDVDIRGWNQFYIITGANMSGKSTFLRTIGVNYILAMAGAPVCAAKLSFSPVEIHSSIRTSDSLVKHESYFYAELKRLKQIIDELESGKQKLILLDEILKGTNSKDKQAGSIALIEQLLHYKSAGLFATHDLMLGELALTYPGNVNNLCFEIEIENDKMVIDYKLHKGICKNINATYLMKNMGILFEK